MSEKLSNPNHVKTDIQKNKLEKEDNYVLIFDTSDMAVNSHFISLFSKRPHKKVHNNQNKFSELVISQKFYSL